MEWLNVQFFLLLFTIACLNIYGFIWHQSVKSMSGFRISYSYFPFNNDKSEKIDPKRLIKNILFPG